MSDTRDKLAAWLDDEAHGLDWIGTDPDELTDALLASDVLRDMLAEARQEGALRELWGAADDLRQGRLGIDFNEAADELDDRADRIERDGGN